MEVDGEQAGGLMLWVKFVPCLGVKRVFCVLFFTIIMKTCVVSAQNTDHFYTGILHWNVGYGK